MKRGSAMALGFLGTAHAWLEMRRLAARWEEPLEGVVAIECGRKPHRLTDAWVSLTGLGPRGFLFTQDLLAGGLFLTPREVVRQPFRFVIPWGTPFHLPLMLQVSVRSGMWKDDGLKTPIEVLPPRDCAGAALQLAREVAGTVRTWSALEDGGVAAVVVPEAALPLGVIHLELHPSEHTLHVNVVFRVATQRWGSFWEDERFEIQFPRFDHGSARAQFRAVLEQFRWRSGELANLPIASPPAPAAPESLPIPGSDPQR
jgi:hypothetical protein